MKQLFNKNKGFTLPNFLPAQISKKFRRVKKKNLRGFTRQNFASQNLGGFTLTELLVVIAIIILLTGIVFFNYRSGSRQLALQRSIHKLAQDIRKAQELSMSSKEFQGEVPAGGYGIYFNLDDPTLGSKNYILFADFNSNYQYNEGELYKKIELEKSVQINFLSPSPLTITFTPPDPTIRINQSANSAATIILEAEGNTRSINVNIAGLIDID